MLCHVVIHTVYLMCVFHWYPQSLYWAAYWGELDKVQQLISQGAHNVNYKSEVSNHSKITFIGLYLPGQ